MRESPRYGRTGRIRASYCYNTYDYPAIKSVAFTDYDATGVDIIYEADKYKAYNTPCTSVVFYLLNCLNSTY